MLWMAIFLGVLASFYWTVREFLLRTFKNAARKKSFIIGFALIGIAVALALILVLLVRTPHETFPTWVLVGALALCPSFIANDVFMDIPHPRLVDLVLVDIFIVVMNAALWAAIGGRLAERAAGGKSA
jgi:hypothetical protein